MTRVVDAAEVDEQLRSGEWDLIISDYNLPGSSGGEVLATLKEAQLDIPFLLISGVVGEEAAVAALRAGASDYLLKDRLGRLVPVIERELAEAANRRAAKALRASLEASRANALKAATERARVLGVLHRISVAASGVVDEMRLAQLTVEGAIELVGGDGALLRWYDADQDKLRLIAAKNDRNWTRLLSISPKGSVLGEAFLGRAPVVTNDYRTSAKVIDSVRLEGVAAMLAIPLLVDDRAVGALGVVSYGNRRFNKADVTILSLLGHEVAAAISSAKLHSELVESEARFRGAFDGSGVGMALFDPDYALVQVNDAICRMLGRPANGLLGKRLRDFAEPADMEAIDPEIQRLRAGEKAHHVAEVRYRHANGHRVRGRLHVSVIRENDGRVKYFLAQVEDLTQAKTAEDALQVSEARNAAVIDAALDGMIILDAVSRIIEFNPAAAAIFGWSREEVLGRDVFEVIHPERLQDTYRERGQRLRKAGPGAPGARFELVARRKDGGELPIELSLSRLETGGAPFFCASIRDLTDRDRLSQNRALLAQVVESAPVILFAFTAAGTITLAEGSLLGLVGATAANLVGTNVLDVVRNAPVALEHVKRSLAGEGFSGPIDLPTLNLWLEANYRPIRDETGTVEGVSGMAVDISDRIRGESARRESEAKSRLVAIVNHEIRTPLNSILGFAELLRLERVGSLNEKQLRYVGNVESAGRHLLALINDSLDLSKIGAGKMDMEISDLELAPILDQAAEQVQPLVESMGLHIKIRSGGKLWARADRRRLLQILWNLLSNGIRHTQTGGTITIQATVRGPGVQIAVRDTGVGIAADHLGRIFEEYAQVGMPAEGTGLGLPVSRRLAQLMDGDIHVTSELGVGTTFTISLLGGRS